MAEPFLNKKLVFEDNIDSAFLFSLYEEDFQYIEEIFKTTLDQVNIISIEIAVAYASGNIGELRKLVHKIKPAFGFTGFLKAEKICKDFEDACVNEFSFGQLANLYEPFWLMLIESITLLPITIFSFILKGYVF